MTDLTLLVAAWLAEELDAPQGYLSNQLALALPGLLDRLDALERVEAAARDVVDADRLAETGTDGADRHWDEAMDALVLALQDADTNDKEGARG